MNWSTGIGNRLGLSGCGRALLDLAIGVPLVSPNWSSLKPSVSRSSRLLTEPQSLCPCPENETV